MKPYPEYKPTNLDWLPQVPAHWEVKRAKWVFKTINERSETGEEELLSVSHITGVTKRKANVTMFKAASYVNYKICRPNDLVINSMWAWMGALGIAPLHGIVSTAYSVYRMDEKQLVPTFANFLLRIKWYAQDFENRSKGIWTSRLMLSDDAFGNTLLALPPLDEQERIVKYLGAKHREIERYIAAKRKLLLRLGELSAATISRAVTRGLILDKALKPSGVEWLGDVPEHWEVKRLKFVVEGNLQYGANESGDPYEENSNHPRYIRITDFGFDGMLKDDGKKTLPPEVAEPYLLEVGDVLFARSGATVGKTFYFGEANETACFAGYLIRARANEKLLIDRFLYYFTKSSIYDLWKNSIFIQATIQNIGADKYGNLSIPLPPLSEQTAIVAYLESQLAIIGEARGRIEREIELARELYQTLVAGVVTGQFDVSGIEVEDDETDAPPPELDDEMDGAEDDETIGEA